MTGVETLTNTEIKAKEPVLSPYYRHHHNQIVTFTHPVTFFTATFQWDGISEVYRPYKSTDTGTQNNIVGVGVDKQ